MPQKNVRYTSRRELQPITVFMPDLPMDFSLKRAADVEVSNAIDKAKKRGKPRVAIPQEVA
ncbi:hypothetical protein [Burkholderia sp. MSMB1459WGS]|uniref:hypothetical protein n=1 Tax=Burkholderia sp. MSMB1459WGS TaxID=1637970 RepID=UPI0012E39AD5|nr:hypothetical protein [Burkholderia sp. MSMB1459WGS]